MDGRLTKALRLKGIKEFKAKDFGLKPIAAAEFGPLVFINLNPDAKKDQLRENFLEVHNILDERQFNVSCCKVGYQNYKYASKRSNSGIFPFVGFRICF